MSNETDLQLKIKNSVIKDGGYSKKLTNRFTIGIPDLLICLYPFVPCIIEVKDWGEVETVGFKRQIGVTPKQRYELNEMSNPYVSQGLPPVTGIFVGFSHLGQHVLVGVPRDTTHISEAYRTQRAWVMRGLEGYYPIKPLLGGMGIQTCQK